MAWACALAAGPVIQRLTPDAVAILPSREVASLSVTYGRPAVIRDRKPAVAAAARAAPAPTSTAIPARRRVSKPPPSPRAPKSVVSGKTGALSVDPGGCRHINK